MCRQTTQFLQLRELLLVQRNSVNAFKESYSSKALLCFRSGPQTVQLETVQLFMQHTLAHKGSHSDPENGEKTRNLGVEPCTKFDISKMLNQDARCFLAGPPCIVIQNSFWVKSSLAKEAKEVMGDAQGRWFTFSATAETVVCLEKQGLPDHLKQLPNIETPMALQALLMDLEDSGEVT